MKLCALLALSLVAVAANGEKINPRHIAKRQTVVSAPSGASTVPPAPSVSSSSSAPAPPVVSSPLPPTTTSNAPVITPPGAPVVTSSSTTPAAPVVTGPPPPATFTGIPPLTVISSGMPTRSTLGPATTYAAGAQPPLSGAPPLPSAFVLNPSAWPIPDHVPDTTSPEVAQWMKELDGHNIPNLTPTVDGSCGGDPAAAADAANRGWWTCGGYTRDTDIVACPDKYTWGVSFDDGPSDYTQYVLNFLQEKDISATFFVVGSRVIQRPALLVEEYMLGHEISVHTWSHSKPLTSMTNIEIVAELGWTRKAIKTVLGVTPTTMRPPWGDIDDRVRAISLAMGMVPIMWTSTPAGNKFDTNDWKVAGGTVNGSDSFNTFETILDQASSQLNTGFIVLQHDLFEVTVDLAVGYTLNAALSHNPKFDLKSIGECQKFPAGNLYLETNQNTTFPFRNTTTGGGVDVSGDGTVDTKPGDGGSTAADTTSGSGTGNSAAFVNAIPMHLVGGSLAAVGFAVMGLLL